MKRINRALAAGVALMLAHATPSSAAELKIFGSRVTKMLVGDVGPGFEQANGHKLTVITDVTYRADGAGYLTPGYSHAFVVSADGGSPISAVEYRLNGGSWVDAGTLSSPLSVLKTIAAAAKTNPITIKGILFKPKNAMSSG